MLVNNRIMHLDTYYHASVVCVMNHIYVAIMALIVFVMIHNELTRPCSAFNDLPCSGQLWVNE
jgi:hypothetical protein